jgi:hypothetical protein
MPDAAVVLVEAASVRVALERYPATGTFAGDTWHRDAAEARAQADFEFPERITAWRDVPDEVDDPVTFALQDPRAH